MRDLRDRGAYAQRHREELSPAENVHVNNILHLSIVPARVTSEVQRKACQLAERVAEGMGAVGLLAVEMFVTEEGSCT